MLNPNAKPQSPSEPTEAEKQQAQKELQKHFNAFKKRFKTKSKSELVAIIWEQGMQHKQLQDIAQELHKELQTLKAVQPSKEPSNEENS